ncbi:MAG: hypothetical protein JNM56_26070 [Planctomycetia bacterium]|nr:hypothetical protein [Planctomycetia bacterium]
MSIRSLPISLLSLPQLQAAFLAIQPRIVRHAEVIFRGQRCQARKDDLIAETVALAWAWFRRLAERGKDARQFPSVLAGYAARAVKSGRRLTGQLKAKDACSERAQILHGFKVERLPTTTRHSFREMYGTDGQQVLDVFEERLHHNLQTPVDEQVAFRCDLPAWMSTRNRRDRRLIRDMAANERTLPLARKYGISPARVSQLRREFHDDWKRFTAGQAEVTTPRPMSA